MPKGYVLGMMSNLADMEETLGVLGGIKMLNAANILKIKVCPRGYIFDVWAISGPGAYYPNRFFQL